MHNDAVSVLRATVEAALPRPGTLVVSSPLRNDGATMLACDLAQAFAAGEQRTLLLVANPRPEEAALALESHLLPLIKDDTDLRRQRTAGINEYLDAIAVSERFYRSSARVASLIGAFRERYDTIVVAAAEVLDGAIDIARRADGVLLAVRHKRLPKREDGESIEMLRRVGAQIVGIVTTDYRARRARSRPEPLPSPKHINVVEVAPERAAGVGT
jgi:Mrp family chromosome partitioning ATPase